MNEREIRTSLYNSVKERIDEYLTKIDKYCENNAKYFTLYPLIYLECGYFEHKVPESISNLGRRGAISWYLNKFSLRHKVNTNNYDFIKKEYDLFCNSIYPLVVDLYQEYRVLREIKDHRSIEHSRIECVNLTENVYQLKTALISDKYKVEAFYFNGLAELERYKKEEAEIMKYTFKYNVKYAPRKKKDIKELLKLDIYVDEGYLQDSIKRVKIDFDKLAETFSSNAVIDKDKLNKLIGFLYYLASSRKLYNSSYNELYRQIDYSNICIVYPIEWFVKKASKHLNINQKEIEKFIEYLTIGAKGQLAEFPIVKTETHIYFIPSSVILNDWHFNIPNGHFAKNIQFDNRDFTISTKLVSDLKQCFTKYNNILLAQEYYYEFYDDEKKLNSDIDLAIYDIMDNKLLILECKWKDNHYISEGDKNYFKIENTLKIIYNEQLSKHCKYLSSETRVKLGEMFKDDLFLEVENLPEIVYYALDKRYQLHIDNMHFLTSYQLMGMASMHSEHGRLNTDTLITEINNLQSKTEYIVTDNLKTIEFDGFSILTDDVQWEYNSNI